MSPIGVGRPGIVAARLAILAVSTLGVLPVALAARDGRSGAPEGAPIAPQSAELPTLPPPLTPGPAPDLDLLFTSQVVGYIEPCG